MEEIAPETRYWRRKLSAFMHDNPGKSLDVKNHEERAFNLRRIMALDDEERYAKEADWQAAAADRLPFPHAGRMVAPFDGRDHPFKHPLAPECEYRLKPGDRLTADLGDEVAQKWTPHLEEKDARGDFIGRWRFWRQWVAEDMPAAAFFPADTRIPDHTIWNHLGLVSAFQGSFDRDGGESPRASLLLFSLGPVQSMIAAARNIRDLWSGSYLLSYLVSTALGEIAKTYGPDHILFPSAWGQPLLDLQLKDIYGQAKVREDMERTLWDQLWRDNDHSRQRFLLPSLPNRFLAILPAGEADAFAASLQEVVRERLILIGEKVRELIGEKVREHISGKWTPSARDDRIWLPDRIETQLSQSLEISWKTLPLPQSIEDAREWGRRWLPAKAEQKTSDGEEEQTPLEALDKLEAMWKDLPKGSHTSYGLNTAASSWPVANAVVSWALDAVKRTQLFEAWSQSQRWEYGREQNKDALTGKEEVVLVAPAEEEEAQKVSSGISGGNKNLLRAGERLGALTLVKRFWHLAYLQKEYDFKFRDFQMPDTRMLAEGRPYGDDSESADDDAPGGDEDGRYIAVLAMDGDEMGKWISGAKTPKVKDLLATRALNYFKEQTGEAMNTFLEMRRPLNPSFHLQFSEALANFGLYAARRIVEAFNGRLIYAGGDDVLALLPADQAMGCARALRGAFRGEADALKPANGYWRWKDGKWKITDAKLFAGDFQRGFLRLSTELKDGGALRGEPVDFDVMVPGPRADVSAGIAVGHHKCPIQDLVEAARRAEKLAKKKYDRSAIALTILKRSGEQVDWGTNWPDPPDEPGKKDPPVRLRGLVFLEELMALLRDESLESRFPHKVLALLAPYLGGAATTGRDSLEEDKDFVKILPEILRKEFDHLVAQSPKFKAEAAELKHAFDSYVESLLAWAKYKQAEHVKKNDEPPPSLTAVVLLELYACFQAAAWLARQKTTWKEVPENDSATAGPEPSQPIANA